MIIKILFIWLILGVLTLWWAVGKAVKPENKEQFEKFKVDFSHDLEIPEDKCLIVVFLICLFFGFFILPVVTIRRIVKFVKGDL